MFVETMNPSEICSVVETTTRKRRTKEETKTVASASDAKLASSAAVVSPQTSRSAPRTGNPIANEAANEKSQSSNGSPLVSNTNTDDGHCCSATQNMRAVVGSPLTTPAALHSQPLDATPEWSSGHITLEPYTPTATTTDIIGEIVYFHRRRQAAIRAKTKIVLMMKAEVRSILCTEVDFEEDKSTDRTTAFGKKPRKLSKGAQKRVDDAIKAARAAIDADDLSDGIANTIRAYVQSEAVFERQCEDYKKQLVRLAKRLPVFEWVKGVNGFGDVSFATIVGECGDIGTYKSVSAVWKRMGLAVINGRRQGNPGEGATAQDWIDHGYNRQRRSVSYVAREHVIGGMGKWRPAYGSNLGDANYYQRIYAERARYESAKLCLPIERSDKGKESYKMHAAMRAHRYVEKRLLRNLYIEWRRSPAA